MWTDNQNIHVNTLFRVRVDFVFLILGMCTKKNKTKNLFMCDEGFLPLTVVQYFDSSPPVFAHSKPHH